MAILDCESKKIHSTKMNRYALLGAFLGWLGAFNLALLAFYLVTTYMPLSRVPPMEKLSTSIYFGVALLITSAMLLMCGSALMLRNNALKGGIVNLSAWAFLSTPTYVYFGFFSEPALLGWLGSLGFLLLGPPSISGVLGIYTSRLTVS